MKRLIVVGILALLLVGSARADSSHYDPAKDFNQDGVINILDVVQMSPPVFNSTSPEIVAPAPGDTWQWQLDPIPTEADLDAYPADWYDIDWEAPKSVVDAIHARGAKAICYVSVGSWEVFREVDKDLPPLETFRTRRKAQR